MPILEIRNLYKNYGKFTALDNLSLTVERGEIFGFVGANGAGKTTAFRILAGLMPATAGHVEINGIDINQNSREFKRYIGYMPDFFGVYEDLRVLEYMNFYCSVYGIAREGRDKLISSLLELVDLPDKKEAYVNNLSRGMKQRLCLARSLIHDPALLILDEPASGLDPRARIEMKEILKTLRGMNKTILISSHILSELSEICTSLVILDKGKLAISGTMDEILRMTRTTATLRIHVLGGISDDVIGYLREQPDVAKIMPSTDYVDVNFSGDDQVQARLLAGLINRGIPVLSYTQLSGNLESVFMHIVKGEPQNDEKTERA